MRWRPSSAGRVLIRDPLTPLLLTAMHTAPAPNPSAVVRMLDRSLRQFFNTACVRRYGTCLGIERRLDVPNDVYAVDLGANDAQATARFEVEHVGGNVYDVRGGLVDRGVRCFTCALPDAPEPRSAPQLARRVGRFLLAEIERSTGAASLQSASAHTASRSATPDRRVPA